MKKIKILTIALMSILVALIAFGGIYTKYLNTTANIVKEYNFYADLDGYREVEYKVIEGDENATVENLIKTKDILEKRLTLIGENNYKIGVDEKTGQVNISLLENEDTDKYLSLLTQMGDFEIIDTETEEVLLTKDQLATVDVMYGSMSYDVYYQIVNLSLAFNDEAISTLEEISKTYIVETVEIEDEDGEIYEETNEKTVTMMLSGYEILTTSFDEILLDGVMEINMGTATDEETFNSILVQAINMKTVLETDTIPVNIEHTQNKYVLSSYDGAKLINIVSVIGLIISALVFLVKLNQKGVLATFITLFTISSILLIIKYTNVEITLMSLSALIAVFVINAVITMKLFKTNKENMLKVFANLLLNIMPLILIAITFTFSSIIGISAFGMMLFWGILITLVVSYAITKNIVDMK